LQEGGQGFAVQAGESLRLHESLSTQGSAVLRHMHVFSAAMLQTETQQRQGLSEGLAVHSFTVRASWR